MRTALITGASSGIGAAAARAFDAAGYRVALVARTAEKLAETAEGLSNKPVVEAVDAANGDAVLAMAERLRADFGVPDVIINNAGAGVWKYIEDTKPAEAITMMNAPYFAAFNVTHAFMSDMLSRRSGVLIHVNSPVAEMVWPSCHWLCGGPLRIARATRSSEPRSSRHRSAELPSHFRRGVERVLGEQPRIEGLCAKDFQDCPRNDARGLRARVATRRGAAQATGRLPLHVAALPLELRARAMARPLAASSNRP